MDPKWSRVWFAATALCVVVGVAVSIGSAATSTTGHFQSSVERSFNTLTFFTVDSNLLVGAAAVLLCINPARSSPAFAAFRLMGVVGMTVTGIVYHVVLARLLDLEGWDQFGNQLVHTVVPVLAVVGWLVFGPRRLTASRAVWLSLIYPVAWLAFTLARGAAVHWYPYMFIDVDRLGYGGAVLNCFWVALLLLGLASGAALLDRRLDPGHPAASEIASG